jgi:hypothetical protein
VGLKKGEDLSRAKRGKGEKAKGERPELSFAPGFSGEAQGNNSAENFGVV